MLHLPFGFLSQGGKKALVPVQNGLYVPAGGIVDVQGGGLLAYEFINVEPGGTLRIRGTTGSWTEIYSLGPITVNGTILCRAGLDGEPTHSSGTFTRQSDLGLGTLSYSITQVAGGKGGDSNGYSTGSKKWSAKGGGQYDGMGGGGGGSSNWDGSGGNGGSANGGGLGNGGGHSGKNGGGGASIGGRGKLYGGGGGGYKGHHGKGLVLYSSEKLEGYGSINASGRNGFSGGSGKSGESGGGGGGAGGSGGRIVICTPINNFAGTITVAGGPGGALGGGLPYNATGAQTGYAGSYQIIPI